MKQGPLIVIDGRRDQIEAEFVRELFESGYNEEIGRRLSHRGDLRLISSTQTEDSKLPDER